MKTGRKNRSRCPFCRAMFADLKAHIEERHLIKYCTVCLKVDWAHPTTPSSPPCTFPCPYGVFAI